MYKDKTFGTKWYQYNQDGNLTNIIILDEGYIKYRYNYLYDGNNMIREERFKFDDNQMKIYSSVEKKYDQFNNKIEEKIFEYGNLAQWKKFKYEDGNLVESKKFRITDTPYEISP